MLQSSPLDRSLPHDGPGSRQILRLFAVVAGTLGVGMLGYYAYGLHGRWPFLQDQAGYVFGRDFLNTWFFGKAAFLPDPGRFYDRATYMAWVNEVIPQDIVNHLWSYPPSFLLMAAPFGLLPYLASLTAWTTAGMLALYAVVRGRALQSAAILFSPAALFCLVGGQISFFMAAFSLAALRLLDRRPLIAGLLISLCTIKPQMGLLFPILLIASRRWRALLAATLGTVGLILATCFFWGVDVWRDYISIGLPTQLVDTKETTVILAPWSVTVTTAMIMAGAKASAAQIVQIGFTFLGIALVVIGCAKGAMNERRIALFLSCSVFAAPYFLAHDLVAATAAVVMLSAVRPLDRIGALAAKAMYLLPMLQLAAGMVEIPGVAAVPICFALWSVFSRDDRTVAPVAVAPHAQRSQTVSS